MAILTVNLPQHPKNTVLEVPPYGSFYNGYSFEVDRLAEDKLLGEKVTTKPHDQELREKNLAKLLKTEEAPPVKDEPKTGDDVGNTNPDKNEQEA